MDVMAVFFYMFIQIKKMEEKKFEEILETLLPDLTKGVIVELTRTCNLYSSERDVLNCTH